MGLRDHFRSRSSSNVVREVSPALKQYGPLPPDAPQPVILNISYATPNIAILTLDSKPLFQVDYSPVLTVTHIPTAVPIGSVSFGANYAITLNQPSTSTNLTYVNTLSPPPYFRSLNGNEIYWIAHAWNKWQCTMHAEIVDGINHPDGVEDDVLVAVILDSRWKKGRIEFRKALMKEEMDLLILSAMAEIEDRKGKMREEGTNVAVGGGGKSQVEGYLKVADSAMNLVNNVNANSGGGGGA